VRREAGKMEKPEREPVIEDKVAAALHRAGRCLGALRRCAPEYRSEIELDLRKAHREYMALVMEARALG
jgi:hypothetical protein